VRELILSFFIESVGVTAIGGFGEVKGFLFGKMRLFEVMETIV
jgi:hypothetical protein